MYNAALPNEKQANPLNIISFNQPFTDKNLKKIIDVSIIKYFD